MEEIYLNELVSYYIKRLYIIAIITILAFVGGKIYLNRQTPMYSSETKIFVSSVPEDEATLKDEEPITDLLIFNGYKDVLLSESMLKDSLADSKVNLTYDEIKDNVSIKSNENSTSIFTIAVNARKKSDAYNLNNSLTDNILYELNNTYKIKSAKKVENANVSNEPYNINYKKKLILFVCMGLFGSIVLIFIKFYFDDTIKSNNGLKNYNLLGEMPKKSNKLFNDKIGLIKSRMLLGSDAKVILITSVNQNSNIKLLAQSLAKECSINNKVLYLNGNLRSNKHSEFGYSDLIENYSKKNNIDDYIKINKGLSVLNNGTHKEDPIALLSNQNNNKILDDLKTKYDYIFIETTDLENKSDPLVLSKLADKTIVLVEQNKTKMEDLISVKETFKQIDSEISGIVFNTSK